MIPLRRGLLLIILYYIMETKQKKSQEKKSWEYKDKNYYLLGNKTPLTYTIPSRHSRRYPLVWFDPDLGYERELRYATNQKSVFVDEQGSFNGSQRKKKPSRVSRKTSSQWCDI